MRHWSLTGLPGSSNHRRSPRMKAEQTSLPTTDGKMPCSNVARRPQNHRRGSDLGTPVARRYIVSSSNWSYLLGMTRAPGSDWSQGGSLLGSSGDRTHMQGPPSVGSTVRDTAVHYAYAQEYRAKFMLFLM